MTELAPLSKPIPAFVSNAASRSRATTAVVAGASVALVFRLLLILRYRYDSDETQHLHVAWAWAHGLVQYRDVFDNHMPLFHLLFAPLFSVAGESPSTLLIARLAMLPFFFAMAWLTYRIASACLPPQVAIAATIIGCLAPDFFLCSIEFRTDVLWAASWVAAIAILVCAPLTPRSATASGFALGIAAAISAKTSLLAASLAAAAILTMVVTRARLRPLWSIAIPFAIAAIVPVAVIAAYFASIGAWHDFVYCTVSHNVVASEHPARLFLVPIMAVFIGIATRAIVRAAAPLPILRRRAFLFLTASIYASALISFWPIIETEHWLPFYPIAAAGFAPLIIIGRQQLKIAFALVALELLWTLRLSTPWIDRASASLALIEDAMRLTAANERVVDLKGEFVFRPRATYAVFEKLTKRAIADGRLHDTTVDDILRTRAMIAVPDSVSFPKRGRDFLQRNFVSVGCLRVAGKIVRPGERFVIEVPGEYGVVAANNATATIDGRAGPRFLAPGDHVFNAKGAASAGRYAVMWQRAAVNGFSPFAPDRRCDAADFRMEDRNAANRSNL